ncbi:hypothetical protein BCR39DRAFT_32291 [Naematelia encephala]|uniref:Uncharacterized protein n=1 Tax=Naematelia encephala TaxID=71784 RepID=A0A1Y2BM70_9TREE|nr:hypothetical protein BCR39DRAFT_32291 [Naematelia encephala]
MPPRRSKRHTKIGETVSSKAGNKRKHEESVQEHEEGKPETTTNEHPQKTSKGGRSILDYLLSDEAFNLAYPAIEQGKGETDLPSGQGDKTPPSESAGKRDTSESESAIHYPRDHLTPFQNLVAALILSKPLSHNLGHRTIHTLLNPPFSLRTLSDLDEAGYEGRRKVMWDARTQHKEKTAGQLGDLVEGVRELCGDPGREEDLSDLKGIKEQLEGIKDAKDAQAKLQSLLTEIKGIGPGVVSVFLRRIQGDWEDVFPYIDNRGTKAAVALGLLKEGDGAEDLGHVVNGDRVKMVKLLDVLVGLQLEKKIDEAKKAIEHP